MPNLPDSSAIHRAQLLSMFACEFIQVEFDQEAKPHSSAATATGLALPCVHALFPRVTYSPILPSLSSMPTCDETPTSPWKNEPSDSYVVAPSAVCTTIRRTDDPPREL